MWFTWHMDRLCEKLFTIPETDIKIEWRTWLRAPARKNTNTEGIRWLQDDVYVAEPNNNTGGLDQCHGNLCSLNDIVNLEKNLLKRRMHKY